MRVVYIGKLHVKAVFGCKKLVAQKNKLPVESVGGKPGGLGDGSPQQGPGRSPGGGDAVWGRSPQKLKKN